MMNKYLTTQSWQGEVDKNELQMNPEFMLEMSLLQYYGQSDSEAILEYIIGLSKCIDVVGNYRSQEGRRDMEICNGRRQKKESGGMDWNWGSQV